MLFALARGGVFIGSSFTSLWTDMPQMQTPVSLATLNQTRAKRRALARRGVAFPEQIAVPPRLKPPVQLPEGVDPILDSRRVCAYCGDISDMSLHRWTKKRNFPLPDLRIGQRRFWRLSSVVDPKPNCLFVNHRDHPGRRRRVWCRSRKPVEGRRLS